MQTANAKNTGPWRPNGVAVAAIYAGAYAAHFEPGNGPPWAQVSAYTRGTLLRQIFVAAREGAKCYVANGPIEGNPYPAQHNGQNGGPQAVAWAMGYALSGITY